MELNKDFETQRVKLQNLLNAAGGIPQKKLANAKVLSSREISLPCVKKLFHGRPIIAAELGVAYGDFSQKILDELQPEKFYGIDYFNKDNPYISFWGRHDFEETGMTHEEFYRSRFKEEIAAGKMDVRSGFSWDCLNQFDDDYFDYIYIDAGHDYESVKKDIEVCLKKTKSGGFLQFNDYTVFDPFGMGFYGIVPAVNELLNHTKSEVCYYCLQQFGFCDIIIKINK